MTSSVGSKSRGVNRISIAVKKHVYHLKEIWTLQKRSRDATENIREIFLWQNVKKEHNRIIDITITTQMSIG